MASVPTAAAATMANIKEPNPPSVLLLYRLFHHPKILSALCGHLSAPDLTSLRLVSATLGAVLAKPLFARLHVTFGPHTFTKPSRVQALARIGHLVEHLTFHLPHSDATFLPPLIHPANGQEISFLYSPHTSMASVLSRPKYANQELADILTQQYPPLFHAATNVASFIYALNNLTNMRHLTVRCPGQDPRERYRRDIVDYALVSLRIAVERAPLAKLAKLSLCQMHPAAFIYLRHLPGIGSVPSAARRWRQIRKLTVSVEPWDFYGPSPGLDHLKILDDYIRHFAPDLEKLSFSWAGSRRGPCPVALSADPLFSPPRATKKLFNEVTSPMSPLPACPPRQPMRFTRIRYMQIRNATMNERQMSGLVAAHRDTVKEFDFENVLLVNGGSWDEALAPLTKPASSTKFVSSSSSSSSLPSSRRRERWSRNERAGGDSSSVGLSSPAVVVLPFSPAGDGMPSPPPSAAARVASEELLGIDLALFGLSGEGTEEKEEAADEEKEEEEEESDLDSGVALSTTLTKKRVHRRKHKKHDDDKADRHRHNHQHRHQHRGRSHSRHRKAHHRERDECRENKENKDNKDNVKEIKERNRDKGKEKEIDAHNQSHQNANSQNENSQNQNSQNQNSQNQNSQNQNNGHNQNQSSSLPSTIPEEFQPLVPPPLHFHPMHIHPMHLPTPTPTSSPSPLCITPPRLRHGPQPVLLQAKAYDPGATGNLGGSGGGGGGGIGGTGGIGRGRDSSDPHNICISPVQRDLEQEEAHRLMAEDAEMRTSVLRRARETVLSKLSQEFRKKTSGGTGHGHGNGHGHDHGAAGCGAGFINGSKFREGLFAKTAVSVLPDRRAMESQSALVPLMFSRS